MHEDRAGRVGGYVVVRAAATTTRQGALRKASRAALALLCALAMGFDPSSVAAQDIPIIRDTEIESLLKDYARPILREAGLEQQNIRMRVVNSRAFNAFVLDGGNIFIHTGALMGAETPNEVIGVIAHETGHIARADIAALQAGIKRANQQQLLLSLLGIGLMVAGGVSGGDAGQNLGGLGSATVAGGQEVVVRDFLRLRRQQESGADQAGLSYLTRSKQSGRGMLKTFERLASGRVLSTNEQYLLTHPTEATRLQQLRELVERSPFADHRDASDLQLRHDLMRAKLYGYTAPGEVDQVYPATDNSIPARYARAIVKNCAGRCAKSMPDVDSLIKDMPTNPFFWELKGDLLYRDGKRQETEAPLREALRLLKGNAPQIQGLLARALAEAGDPKLLPRAIDLAERALLQEREDVMLDRLLSVAYADTQRMGEALLMSAELCLLRNNPARAHILAKRAMNEFAQRPADDQRSFQAKRVRASDIVITTQAANGNVDRDC
jgi:predicted Zn-dependent protease